MLRRLQFLVSVLCIVSLSRIQAVGEDKPIVKKKVLYVTTTAGFHHDACEKSVPYFKKMVEESGILEAVITDKTDLITAEGLRGFDLIIFSNTTGALGQFPLSETNGKALIEAITGGKAFVGIHAATDTLADWKPYCNMVGGGFAGHPWSKKITIDVEDPAHPAMSPVPSPWMVNDEIYTFKDWSRDKVHVLMSMDIGEEKEKGNRPDRDYALAWCKPFGEGRVFYTGLGHNEEVWKDPVFQRHLMGGILWALKIEAEGKTHPIALGHKKPQGKWTRIFDGKTLEFGKDWEASDDPKVSRKHWTVQPGGILQGTWSSDSSHLYYTGRKFKNFEYRAEVCIDKDGNSGMYFRCVQANHQPNGQWKNWPEGYEAQVNNGYAHDPKRSGTFYPSPTLYDADIKKYLGYEKAKDDNDFWFTQQVTAVGNHFVIKLNGQVVVDHYDDQFREAGYFAFQMHHGGTVVKFRNIEVRELE